MVLVAITEVVGIIVRVTVTEGTTVCEGSTVAGEGTGVHADRQSASITKASTDLSILLLTREFLRFQHSKNILPCQPPRLCNPFFLCGLGGLLGEYIL
jgi:hypothetical protein